MSLQGERKWELNKNFILIARSSTSKENGVLSEIIKTSSRKIYANNSFAIEINFKFIALLMLSNWNIECEINKRLVTDSCQITKKLPRLHSAIY